MTLADLRRALELLPQGASLTLPRDALLEALDGDSQAPPAPDTEQGTERALSAREVAERLSTSTRWVYDHREQLGGKRLSRRCVRFPEAAVRRYMARPR